MDQLLGMIADPHRIEWEKNKLDGQSLVKIRANYLRALQDKEEAVAYDKVWDKRLFVGIIAFAIIVLASILSKMNEGWVMLEIIVCALAIGGMFNELNTAASEKRAAEQKAQECVELFEAYKKAIADLDPHIAPALNPNPVDATIIRKRMISLAGDILHAKAKLEVIRLTRASTEAAIRESLKWIDHCERLFLKIWTAAGDFGIDNKKEEIFRLAQEQLDKTATPK